MADLLFSRCRLPGVAPTPAATTAAPTPVLIDVERDLWRAGYRERAADGRECRMDGEAFDNTGAP